MKILYNARINTLDPEHPVASALAIEAGKIVAVGSDDIFSGNAKSEREDMQGMVILPGLTDAHLHLQRYAFSFKVLDCEYDSRQEILQKLEDRLRQTPAGNWFRGHGWNQNTWGGDWPSAAELDAIAPHHPVYLTAKSLHAAWANSLAMQLAGIDATTPDPANGKIQRNEHGQPTGIFFENALNLIEKAIPVPEPDDIADTIQQAIPKFWRLGLTGVHDFDRRDCFLALQNLHANHKLRLRVLKSIPLESLPQALELGLGSGLGDDFLRIGSVKLFADGALGPHTAAMQEPYVDDPENCGILQVNARKIFDLGRQASESRLSLAVHTIGDRAVHEVLDGFESLRRYESERGLPALRHRIEHVQTILPEDAGRLADLSLIASMQPIHATSDMQMADRFLGKRVAFSYAWRTQLECGARLAFGSDAPVENPNPFHGLHAAVTRRRMDGSPGPDGWTPDQRLPIKAALAGFTSGPAYAAGMEDRLGRLSAGFLADLIVIETDPFICEPSELYGIHPVATMLAGEWVWRS